MSRVELSAVKEETVIQEQQQQQQPSPSQLKPTSKTCNNNLGDKNNLNCNHHNNLQLAKLQKRWRSKHQ